MTDSSESTADRPAVSAGRAAVLIPGGRYTVDAPLLFFSNVVADARQAYVESMRWSPPALDQTAQRRWFSSPEAETWACAQVSDALERVSKHVPDAAPVLIGKSLASCATPVAADRNLPAVWFTPLLTVPGTVAALRRTTAPFLLVGGTADNAWDGRLARELTPHVLEIPGADHTLEVPGRPLAVTLAAHGQAMTALEEFLDREVWHLV